jgi:hypothetical protein
MPWDRRAPARLRRRRQNPRSLATFAAHTSRNLGARSCGRLQEVSNSGSCALDGDRWRVSRGKTTGTRIILVPRGQFADSASTSHENSGNRDVPGANVARTAGTYFCHLAAIDPGAGVDGGREAGLLPGAGKTPCQVATPLPGAGEAACHRAAESPACGTGVCQLATIAAGTGFDVWLSPVGSQARALDRNFSCGRSPSSLTCFKYSRRRRGPTTDADLPRASSQRPPGPQVGHALSVARMGLGLPGGQGRARIRVSTPSPGRSGCFQAGVAGNDFAPGRSRRWREGEAARRAALDERRWPIGGENPRFVAQPSPATAGREYQG